MYVFDSNSLIALSNFYPSRFPTLWNKIDNYVLSHRIISVREAWKEVTNTSDRNDFDTWINNNKAIFKVASAQEAKFVAEILQTKNFKDIIRKKQLLTGMPVADPFIIASARINNFTVITEESYRQNSAKIPNICRHFQIPYLNLQGFMEQENWIF